MSDVKKLSISQYASNLHIERLKEFQNLFKLSIIDFRSPRNTVKLMGKTQPHLKHFFFYLGFLSRTFTNHRTAGEGEGHFFNSSLLLQPDSQTLSHQPGDYCREFTFAHSQQPESNRERMVSKRKSLTTKLSALNH